MRVQMETTWGSTRRGDVLVGQGEDGGNALLRGWVERQDAGVAVRDVALTGVLDWELFPALGMLCSDPITVLREECGDIYPHCTDVDGRPFCCILGEGHPGDHEDTDTDGDTVLWI